MPNRMIKESSRTSPTLARLSHGAERCFWRLITLADDFGRFNAEPSVVRGLCFSAMLEKITKRHVSGWLDELRRAGLISCYRVGDSHVAVFVTWSKHERTRAEKSKFPDPTASDSICCQALANAPVVEVVVEDVSEIEVEDGDERARAGRAGDSVSTPGFQDFWGTYPNKTGRGAAERAWGKISPDAALAATILRAVAAQCAGEEFRRDNGRYVPRPAKWLAEQRWTDEVKAAPPWSADTHGLERFARKGLRTA